MTAYINNRQELILVNEIGIRQRTGLKIKKSSAIKANLVRSLKRVGQLIAGVITLATLYANLVLWSLV